MPPHAKLLTPILSLALAAGMAISSVPPTAQAAITDYEAPPVVVAGENLARTGTATAKSSWDATVYGGSAIDTATKWPQYLPANAIDSNTNTTNATGTKWGSRDKTANVTWGSDSAPSTYDPSEDWFQVELATPALVTQVVISWEAACSTNYDIQLSKTGADGSWTTVATSTANCNKQIITTDFAAPAEPVKFVRMQSHATRDEWGLVIWDFQIYASTGGDWAYQPAEPASWPSVERVKVSHEAGVVATAKSEWDGKKADGTDYYPLANYVAANAIDGSTGTKWGSRDKSSMRWGDCSATCAYNPDEDWIQVELPTASPVYEVKLNWEGADSKPDKFMMQVSNDGTTWVTVARVENPPIGVSSVMMAVDEPVKFVRMQSVVARQWGLVLWEFEVYSAPPAGPAVTGDAAMVLPQPVSAVASAAGDFALTADSRIVISTSSLSGTAEVLAGYLRPSTGFELPVVTGTATAADVALNLGAVAELPATTLAADEGYKLVTSANGAAITAPAAHGIFNGFQTLLQLLPADIASTVVRTGPWQAGAFTIVDYPRYAYRGLLVDEGRNFVGVEGIKKIIDNLAQLKGSILHWHLTENVGWRLEIKNSSIAQYSSLGLNSGEGCQNDGGGCTTGIYTQEQFSEIVAYANARFVQIMPEIDMPGHSRFVTTKLSSLGVNCSNNWCNSEASYAIIDDIIGQVAALSPYEYIHIGGDEVSNMSSSDYDAFIKRVEQIAKSHGKKIAGWTPAIDHYAEPTSAGHYWWTYTPQSSWFDHGQPWILSPEENTYLDYIGTNGVLAQSYSWDPQAFVETLAGNKDVPTTWGLKDEDVLGVEACVWGEKVAGPLQVMYNAFPELAGIVQKGWSTRDASSQYTEYLKQLAKWGTRAQFQDTNFRPYSDVSWEVQAAGSKLKTEHSLTVSGELAGLASPGVGIGSYTATIDWGDGSAVETATISGLDWNSAQTVKQGRTLLRVNGTHTYPAAQEYTGTVTYKSGSNTYAVDFTVDVEAPLPIAQAGGVTLPGAAPGAAQVELNGSTATLDN
ncbi:MAG: family 20 glycosylhydrolase, partial [Propionibacteriaceae bacterium]|nr:family 20 glycosylhydrolase [Propionibacteriaceae bacterium]